MFRQEGEVEGNVVAHNRESSDEVDEIFGYGGKWGGFVETLLFYPGQALYESRELSIWIDECLEGIEDAFVPKLNGAYFDD